MARSLTAALVVAAFIAGFLVCHLMTRRGRRLRIDWRLTIDADRADTDR